MPTTLHITLPPDTEARLRERALARGQDLATTAARLIDEGVRRPDLDQILAPVRRAFEVSGMSEDDLSELLEREKHAMRAEKNGGHGLGPRG
jgi:hypothetical protein